MKTIDRPGSFTPEGTGESTKPQKDTKRPTKTRAALAALLATATAYAGTKAISNSESTPLTPKDKVEAVVEMNEDMRSENEKLYDFVDKYKDIALEAATKNPEKQLPYELLLAVAIHESNYGQSELARNANNFFGIIAKDGWEGDIYTVLTSEEINGKDIKMTRPFRKYDLPDDSFEDFVNKLYFKNQDGSYRYSDAVKYIQQGGDDPKIIVDLLSDKNEPGEMAYATDSEWGSGIKNVIEQIQSVSELSEGRIVTEQAKPETSSGMIDIEKIDFSSLDPEEHSGVIEAQKEGFSRLSIESFKLFKERGITKIGKSGVLDILGSGVKQREYIADAYGPGIDESHLQYLVLHLWGNGVSYDKKTHSIILETGNSHKATLSGQIKSWYGLGKKTSCGYLLSDNGTPDLWQLTEDEFGVTNHVGTNIRDLGHNSHKNVNNYNAIGIEVQADSILDVSPQQYETLIYWATKLLIDAGKIHPGMSESVVHQIVDKMVIGHGKEAPNEDDKAYSYEGYEFGYKYTRPIIDAISQFAYAAVNQED
jgi:flagellum-specific peptidoglycan hydrolase FlgJ